MPRTMLVAKVKQGGITNELRIEVANQKDSAFILDCNTTYRGSPAFMELPRRYQTLRGAKQAARLLIGESLDWKEPEDPSAQESSNE